MSEILDNRYEQQEWKEKEKVSPEQVVQTEEQQKKAVKLSTAWKDLNADEWLEGQLQDLDKKPIEYSSKEDFVKKYKIAWDILAKSSLLDNFDEFDNSNWKASAIKESFEKKVKEDPVYKELYTSYKKDPDQFKKEYTKMREINKEWLQSHFKS
jgi:hypothetical protein